MRDFLIAVWSWILGAPTHIPSTSQYIPPKKRNPLFLPVWKRLQRMPTSNPRMFYCAYHNLDKNGKPTPYRRGMVL